MFLSSRCPSLQNDAALDPRDLTDVYKCAKTRRHTHGYTNVHSSPLLACVYMAVCTSTHLSTDTQVLAPLRSEPQHTQMPALSWMLESRGAAQSHSTLIAIHNYSHTRSRLWCTCDKSADTVSGTAVALPSWHGPSLASRWADLIHDGHTQLLFQ